MNSNLHYLPAGLAAVAFVAFVAAFLYELFTYQGLVIRWANGDINSRAHLAAANLAEPLRTQDFKTIRQIGNACEADGVHLKVTSARGGVIYDSRPRDAQDTSIYSDRSPSGEYWVVVGMPQEQVLASFNRALRGFCLAGLVGMAGVLLFFFVTYRQRVRIRELKRVEKFRRDFIADVSHEIKTPLTGILGAVEMMDEEEPRDEVEKIGGGGQTKILIPLIKKETKRLNGLVQSILDLARLEREDQVLHLVDTDLVPLIRDLATRYHIKFFCPQLANSNSNSITLRCDPQLIEQAVENLLVNAIRHSGTDDITVTLAADAKAVRIVVEDHGIGIPPEHAAQIFERFHRVDPARSAESGGAGLGLAIVRRIARLHGGEVTLSTATPHGCRFVLTFAY